MVDLLLTPLLNRVLRKFIRSSSEGAGSELRVSLSTRGTLTLHNLELCLDPLLEGVGFVSVNRAFARKLQVTVPWTGLGSQPIQVVLDTVELVLGPGDLPPPGGTSSNGGGGAAASAQQDPDTAASGGNGSSSSSSSWLGGTLQSFAVRAGLNISVKLNNVVAKYVETGAYAASLTFSSLELCTSTDGWRDALQNPEAWLKKECTVRGLSVCLDQCGGGGGKLGACFQPVLRAPSIRVAAQLPAFAFLEGAELQGDPFKTTVHVALEPVDISVNNWQLHWAGMLAALLQRAAAAKAEAKLVAAEAAAKAAGAADGVLQLGEAVAAQPPEQDLHQQHQQHQQQEQRQRHGSLLAEGAGRDGAMRPPPLQLPGHTLSGSMDSSRAGSRAGGQMWGGAEGSLGKPAKPATKALGVFGRVWDYVVDEAQYLETIETEGSYQDGTSGRSPVGSPHAAATQQPMHAELDIQLKGLSVHLAVVEACSAEPQPEQAQQGQQPQEQQHGQPEQQQPEPAAAEAVPPQPLTAAAAPPMSPSKPGGRLSGRLASTPAEQEQAFLEALQAQLAGKGAPAPAPAHASRAAAEVHPVASLVVQQASANISSVDVSFTSVEVQLGSLSLCRNAAAAALPPSLFTPGDAAASSPPAAAQGPPPHQAPLHPHHSISAPALTGAAGLVPAASEASLIGSPLKAGLTSLSSSQGASPLRPHHSRSASGSLAGLDLLHSVHSGASLAGAGSSSAAAAAVVVHYHAAVWDEVLGLHPLDAAAAAGGAAGAAAAAAAAAAALGQPLSSRDSRRAVHIRWQGSGDAGAAASAADGPGQRCAVHLGQLFVCWAPGFATSAVLLVQPSLAAFSAKPQDGASEAERYRSDKGGSDTGPGPASDSHSPDQAASSTAVSSGDSSGSSPLSALLSGVVLEAHVGLLQLGLLSSQGTGAAGVVLSLSQIQFRSGALNWHSSWNRHLRECLLAPPGGFEGLGLRTSVRALSVAVAQQWQPCKCRAGQLEVAGCSPVSSGPELQAVVAFAAPTGGPSAAAPAAAGGVQGVSKAPGSGAGPAAAGAAPPAVSGVLGPAALPPPPLLVSAALSPFSLQLTGRQLAGVLAAVGGLTAELGRKFAEPLPLPEGSGSSSSSNGSSGGGSGGQQGAAAAFPSPPVVEAAAQTAAVAAGTAAAEAEPAVGSGPAWIGSVSLELGSLQVAFAQGGARGQLSLGTSSAAGTGSSMSGSSMSGSCSPPPDLPSAAQLLVCCPVAAVTLAASPAAMGLACGRSAAAAAPPVAQLLLVRPLIWAVPGFGLALPAAELRLGRLGPAGSSGSSASGTPGGSTALEAAEAATARASSCALHDLPALLLAGACLVITPTAQPGGQGSTKAAPVSTTAIRLGSVSLAVRPEDFQGILSLLSFTSCCPALPPWQRFPQVETAPAATAAPTAGDDAGAAAALLGSPRAAGPAQQPPAAAAGGTPGSKLSVAVDQVCVSISTWEGQGAAGTSQQGPQQAQQAQHAQQASAQQAKQAQHGLAGWASRLEFTRGPAPESIQLGVGSLHIVLSRQQQGDTIARTSPAISWPSASLTSHSQALELSLAAHRPRRSTAAAQRQLSARAAPLSLTLSPELFCSIAALVNPLQAALESPQLGPIAPTAPPSAEAAAQPAAGAATDAVGAEAEAAPLCGSVSLQQLHIALPLAASWEPQQPDGAEGSRGSSDGGNTAAAAAAARAAAGQVCQAGAELAIAEVAIMISQAAAAEGRPWLGAGGGLTTSVEASLVAAELLVHHPGPSGVATTTLLSPTDGRLRFLNQQRTGCLAIALHAAALPLCISMPAISAIGALVSTISGATGQLGRPSDSAEPGAADTAGTVLATGRQLPEQQAQQECGARAGAGAGAGAALGGSYPGEGAHVYIEDAELAGAQHAQHAQQLVAPPHGQPPSSPVGGGRQQQQQQQWQQAQQEMLQGPGGSAASPGNGALVDSEGPPPLDDLRWGMFSAVADGSDSDPGPLQIKASSTALKSEGISWPLSPQRQQQVLHCIHWAYPQERTATLLYIEGCTPALLGVEFQLACYSEEAEDFVEVPIRAVALNSLSPASPTAAAPLAGAPASPLPPPSPFAPRTPLLPAGASRSAGSAHDVAILALAAPPSRQWQLLWTAGTSTGAAAAAATVLQRLHINPPRRSHPGVPSHAQMCAELGLPYHPAPPPLAAPLTVVLEAEEAQLSLLAPSLMELSPAPPTAASAGAQGPSGSGLAAAAAAAQRSSMPAQQQEQQQAQQQLGVSRQRPGAQQAQQAQQAQHTWDTLARLSLCGLKLAVHSWPAPSCLAVDGQALLGLHYLDSSTQTSTCLVEPFLLDACYESLQPMVTLPPAASYPHSSTGAAAGPAGGAAAGPASQLASAAAAAGGSGGASAAWGGVGEAPRGAGGGGKAERAAPVPPPPRPQPFFGPGLPTHNLPCLAVRPVPQLVGKLVSLQAGQQPVVVNVSELTIPELQRLVGCLSSSGSSGDSSSGSSSSSSGGGGGSNPPPLLVENQCGLDLCLGQVGTQECLQLPSGVSLPYRWAAPPALVAGAVRKLRVAAAGTSQRREQQQQEAGASQAAELAWSLPFEAMAQSACQLRLPLSPDLVATVAVQVRREGATWRVLLQPAIRLVNHLGLPIQCCVTAPALSPPAHTELDSSGRQSSDIQQEQQQPLSPQGSLEQPVSPLHQLSPQQRLEQRLQQLRWQQEQQRQQQQQQQQQQPVAPAGPHLEAQSLQLGIAGSAVAPLVHWRPPSGSAAAAVPAAIAGARGSSRRVGPTIRLWLGAEEGWSSEVALEQLRHGVQVLHAAQSPPAASVPPTCSALPSLGAVLCQLQPVSVTSGQALLSFWPPVLLQNLLPQPLALKLRHTCPAAERAGHGTAGAAGVAAGAAGSEPDCWRSVGEGECLPLLVQHAGGALAQLALQPPGQQQQQGQQQGRQGQQGQQQGRPSRLSIPVLTPPMVGAARDSGPGTAAGDEGQGLTIPQPGDFALLEVPCPPQTPPAAAAAVAAEVAAPAGGVPAVPLAAGPAETQLLLAAAAAPGSTRSGGSMAADMAADVGGGSLECALVTEQFSEELPVLRVAVLPLGVVRNCLPVPLTFQVPGCAAVWVPPHSSVPIDWRPLPSRPRQAQVSLQAASTWCLGPEAEQQQQLGQGQGQGQGGSLYAGFGATATSGANSSSGGNGSGSGSCSLGSAAPLVSQKFPIDDTLNTHLVLRPRGAKAGPSRGLRVFIEGAKAQQGPAPPECRLAAQVSVEKHAAGVDTVYIKITPGCFVSNLSGLPLLLHPEGSAAATCLAGIGSDPAGCEAGQGPGGPAAAGTLPWPLCGQQQLGDGATLPLLNVWGGDLPPPLTPSPLPAAGSIGEDLLLAPVPAAAPAVAAAAAAGAASPAQSPVVHRRMATWGGAGLLRSLSGNSTALQQAAASASSTPRLGTPNGASAAQQAQGPPALRFAISAAATPAAATPPASEATAVAAAIAAAGSSSTAGLQAGRHSRMQAAAGSGPPSTQAAAAAEPAWSSRIDPFDPVGRQRLYLQDPSSGGAALLTYRTLMTAGRMHVVLFRDRQPPFTIHNCTSSALELGYCPPKELASGGFEYSRPRYALRVAAGQLVECDFNPDKGKASAGLAPGTEEVLSPRRSSSSTGRGGWEDEEDEDAFLDCLLQEELRARGQAQDRPPAVVKFREPGTKDWAHPVVLMPGQHLTGASTCVVVSRACATTHIVIQLAAGAAGTAAADGGEAHGQGAAAFFAPAPAQLRSQSGIDAAAPAAAEEPPLPPQPLRLSLHCRQLQLCVWDDDRRRLLPVVPATVVSAGVAPPLQQPPSPHSPQLPQPRPPLPGHIVALPPAAAKELFCITVDGLTVGVFRGPQEAPSASAHPLAAAAGQQLSSGGGGGGGGSGGIGGGIGGGSRPSYSQPTHAQQQQGQQGHQHAQQGALASTGSGLQLVEYRCQVLASGLHCDSFLPGSEYPVVLTSLDSEEGGLGRGSEPEGEPLQLMAVVLHSPTPAHPLPSFRNAWVHRLVIKLPTLAVALDDALLAFADQAKGVLGAGGGEGGGAGTAEPGVDSQEGTCRHAHHESELSAALAGEARGAAASRLYIETAAVEPVRALADVHLSKGTVGLPMAVDVHRAPVTLSRIAAHSALFRPHVLVRGLMAHGIAEALLNAPQMLGSLELLFNPTGLVQSVRQGVSDLVGLPMAALQARSPSQFLANVGRGSASLVRHLTGWTLSSITGFSSAFSRAVDSAVAIRAERRAHAPPPPNVGRGLVQGLTGLVEGVAAGCAAVVEAPIQGYSSGSGVLSGLGRGLLGAIGLPVSGALELVGSVSAGLASSAGIVHRPEPRRAGREAPTPAAALALPPAAWDAEQQQQQQQQRGSSQQQQQQQRGSSQQQQHQQQQQWQRPSGAASSAAPAVVLSASRLLAQARAALPGWQLGGYIAHCPLEAAAVEAADSPSGSVGPASGPADTGSGRLLLRAPVLLLTERAVVVCAEGGLFAVAALLLADLQLQERRSTQEATLASSRGALVVAVAAGGREEGAVRGSGVSSVVSVRVRATRFEWLAFVPVLRRHILEAGKQVPQ